MRIREWAKALLIQILIWFAIFALVELSWLSIEMLRYGTICLSIEDTFFEFVLSWSLYGNLMHRVSWRGGSEK